MCHLSGLADLKVATVIKDCLFPALLVFLEVHLLKKITQSFMLTGTTLNPFTAEKDSAPRWIYLLYDVAGFHLGILFWGQGGRNMGKCVNCQMLWIFITQRNRKKKKKVFEWGEGEGGWRHTLVSPHQLKPWVAMCSFCFLI